jgi:hypothetical protein
VVIQVPDERFGTFTVTGEWDPRVVTVTGPWRSTVTLSATSSMPQAMKRRLIWLVPPPRITPISRDAVELRVDDEPAPLDCGRRAMRRATFDVRATVSGRDYLLRHRGRWRAHLERGGQPVIELSTSDHGGMMSAAYRPAADVTDATLAVALGATLGIGAPGFFRNLLAGI